MGDTPAALRRSTRQGAFDPAATPAHRLPSLEVSDPRRTAGEILGRVEIRPLGAHDRGLVDRHLPLARLDQHDRDGSTYLIAWDGEDPVGHAHIAWEQTHAGVPEIQDVYVLPDRRRRGIATHLTRAAEDEARVRGFKRISLSVSAEGNDAARDLYDALGYREAGLEPVRVLGTIMLRGEPFDVDDTLVYLDKAL